MYINTNQIPDINKAPMPVLIYYGETPPEYEREVLTYIDTPPNYEEPIIIVSTINKDCKKVNKKIVKKQKKTKITEDNLFERKGKCCYSKESDDSRCCGVCYWLCTSNTHKERCECCPNTFCDYWKSGYIQTTEGSVNKEDSCREFECDDCFCTVICFPFKFPVFFPCFLGSLFNEGVNKLCESNRNYLF